MQFMPKEDLGSSFYFQLCFAHVNAAVNSEHMEEVGEGALALTAHAARLTFAKT